MTLKDVAREAGVSVGMASRVISRYGSYSEETARRVLEAARRLDYRPNMLARSLRVGRTRAIGLVASYLVAPGPTTFARDVDAVAAQHSLQVLVGAVSDPGAEGTYLRTLHQHNVAGIIASPSPASEPVVAELVATGLPMVLVGNDNPELGASRVNLADLEAGRAATEHLLALGHERVALLTGAVGLGSGRRRLDGYRAALAGARLEPDDALVRAGLASADDAYEATEHLLDLSEPPTAVVVADERLAGAVLRCLKDRDVSVPGQLSLVTFDDPPWATFYRPAVTAMRVPWARVARLAVETLLAPATGRAAAAPDVHVVDLELVVRESTAPPSPVPRGRRRR